MLYLKTLSLQECTDIAHKNGYTMIMGWSGFAYLAEIVDMETGALVAKGVIKDSTVNLVGDFAVDAEIYNFVKVGQYVVTVTAKDILDKLKGKYEIAYGGGEIQVYLKPADNYVCSIYFKSLDDKFNIQSNSALWPYFV